MITIDILRTVMPRCPTARVALYLPSLQAACAEFEIDTPRREAALLAQLAHESGELRYMEEIADGDGYENRRDLGNVQPGDGRRYKGRGPIQLTGRDNYRTAGAALGLDLEGCPEQVATPEVGFRVAGWYWTTHGKLDVAGNLIANCNDLADQQRFKALTRAINGGLNGYDSRAAYYERAATVLDLA